MTFNPSSVYILCNVLQKQTISCVSSYSLMVSRCILQATRRGYWLVLKWQDYFNVTVNFQLKILFQRASVV